MGNVIDINYELRVRSLARNLVRDLGLQENQVETWGGGPEIANHILGILEGLPGQVNESIEDDHAELFELLRARTGQ